MRKAAERRLFFVQRSGYNEPNFDQQDTLMQHLIIDVETMGIAEDSVILQISAALHNTENKEQMFEKLQFRNWKLQAKPQTQFGRKVDADTLKWWKDQPHEVQLKSLIPSKDDVDPEVAIQELEDWLKENGFNKKTDVIWQRGSKDQDWICSLASNCGWIAQQMPISYHRVRDIRTCVDVLGWSTKLNGYPDNADELRAQVPGYKQHDAESDIKLELLILRQCEIL